MCRQLARPSTAQDFIMQLSSRTQMVPFRRIRSTPGRGASTPLSMCQLHHMPATCLQQLLRRHAPLTRNPLMYVRDIVLGVNDGIVSMFLLQTGAWSASLTCRQILLFGVCGERALDSMKSPPLRPAASLALRDTCDRCYSRRDINGARSVDSRAAHGVCPPWPAFC
jgi:hypothetical protein